MTAKNCWEDRGCGRGPGGDKVAERGVCPAATVEALNGIHGGKNGGRACWGVIGTFCDGLIQESLAQKLAYCVGCSFRKEVEDGEREVLSPQEIAARAGQ